MVRITAVGDVSLGGVSRPFDKFAQPFDADIVFGNLECVLNKAGSRREKAGERTYNLAASPASARELAKQGFSLMCLANNHSFDFGLQGVKDTIRALESAQVGYVGVSINREGLPVNSWRIIMVAGVKVIALAFAEITGSATQAITSAKRKSMLKMVRDARSVADLVVVSYHGGVEWQSEVSSFYVGRFREIIDAGADIVIGHHPHVVQPMERYRRGLIAYSLGNFVFPAGVMEGHPEASESVVLEIDWRGRGDFDVRIIPIRIEDGRPLIENTPAKRKEIMDRMSIPVGHGSTNSNKEFVDDKLSTLLKNPWSFPRKVITHWSDVSFKWKVRFLFKMVKKVLEKMTKRIGQLVVHIVFRNRSYLHRRIREFAKGVSGKKILEIGSGKPVRGSLYYSASKFFTARNKVMLSDINPEYGHAVVDITTMEAESEYDVILCLNVLEHVFDVQKGVDNMYRALREGGQLVVFVPGFYPLHDEPHDYYRFSEHALRRMFARFRDVDVRHHGLRRYPFAYFVVLRK